VEGLTLRIQGDVATVAIDRPQARNALNLAAMRALGLALDEAESKRARVLVIRGAGDKAFCAGGDLKELEHMRSSGLELSAPVEDDYGVVRPGGAPPDGVLDADEDGV